jgi:hypothetical protein
MGCLGVISALWIMGLNDLIRFSGRRRQPSSAGKTTIFARVPALQIPNLAGFRIAFGLLGEQNEI